MSSEQPDESNDAAPPTPSDGGTESAASSEGDGKRSAGIAEVSGYATLLIIIGLISGVITPPANLILAAIGTVIALVYYVWRSQYPSALQGMIMLLVAALGFTGGYVGRPMLHSAWEHLTGECDDPVELTVLLPVDGASGFEAGIERFNERYLDSGCKRANVTAYSAPWQEVQRALELGWKAEESPEEDLTPEGFVPQRDVGPRPDLWLAESTAQVDLAEALLDGMGSDDVLDADEADPIGWTPLVMAVPSGVFASDFGAGGQVRDTALSELVEQLSDRYETKTPVVRSDPTLSQTALMSLESLYEGETDAVGTRMEKQLARSAENAGLGVPGTDTDLLCTLDEEEGPEPTTAILTTERALSRYNSGKPLGDGCPLQEDVRSGYVPIYLEALGGLHYRTARLHWEDPWAAQRSAVAEELTDWLATGDEGWSPDDPDWWSPEGAGIRSNDYNGGQIDGDQHFVLSHEPSGERLTGGDLNELLDSYDENRVSTNVLLAIDGSLSMNTPVGGDGRSRFELATEGVRAALENLGTRDEAGLWTFPAEGGAAYDPVLDIGSGHGPQEAERLTGHQPVSGVDLHRTLMAGVDALEEAEDREEQLGEEDSIDAMVVLTDGADSDVNADEVIHHAATAEVSLYIIAVGDASCRAPNFADMTERSPQIICIEAEEHQIEATFDSSLFGQLWS